MINSLESEVKAASDPPDTVIISPVSLEVTGKRGRPRKVIDPLFLQTASSLRGPSGIKASIPLVSTRTIRRRLLELDLATPGEPVFEYQRLEDGTEAVIHCPPRTKPSNVTDAELDELVRQCLSLFPKVGRKLLMGFLKSHGIEATRKRAWDSVRRVRGITQPFGRQRITRRVYSVAGPNSLTHHDGYHSKMLYQTGEIQLT